MAADVATGDAAFRAGTPRLLFEGRYVSQNGPGTNYDVSPDGGRFLMIKAGEHEVAASTQINVVVNWFEELKRK